ncbi:TRAP transporter substrate-binding protein DctP [Oceanisphaera sp.]|uniref:TRAP transporter substrate-binding protein DctP n=1 Tax=Oceanisphaera sp. TaxID=1929979 RepID=UPI003A939F3E
MKKYKALALTISSLVFLMTGCNDSEANSKEKTIEWDLSLWGGQRAITLPADDWAAAMYERTDGKWKINIHYGATLSNPQDNLDNLSSGLFEAAAVSPFYTPGKLPLVQVMDLPFIMPSDFESIVNTAKIMFQEPEIIKELDSWNVMPLLPGMTPQYEYMGKVEINSIEDFKGVKIAGMNADIGKVFAEFGAIPTPMPAPELYSSLEYGTIDGVIFPYSYGMGSYNLYEVSNYGTTSIAAGSPVTTFFANKDAWAALPDEFKKIHNDYIENDYLKSAVNHIKNSDLLYESKFQAEGISIANLDVNEREKLVSKSKDVWLEWEETWKERGDTKHLISRIEDVKKSLSQKREN